MFRLEVKEVGQIAGMGFIGTDLGIYKMQTKKRNKNLIEGATPPLSVSPKWKQMRADGSITVSGDHFLIRNNGVNDWNKWYYPLPEDVKKIRVTCKVKADEVGTSPNSGLWISLSNIYDSTFQVYNNQIQTGWVESVKEFTLTTPYVGFLQRGSQYVTGQICAFDIKDLLVEKIG